MSALERPRVAIVPVARALAPVVVAHGGFATVDAQESDAAEIAGATGGAVGAEPMAVVVGCVAGLVAATLGEGGGGVGSARSTLGGEGCGEGGEGENEDGVHCVSFR